MTKCFGDCTFIVSHIDDVPAWQRVRCIKKGGPNNSFSCSTRDEYANCVSPQPPPISPAVSTTRNSPFM